MEEQKEIWNKDTMEWGEEEKKERREKDQTEKQESTGQVICH
jgi:hypothetical protein